MSLRIEDPAWLWLLAAALPLAVVALYAFTAMARLRRAAAIAARVLLLSLLVAALAGASSIRRTDKASIVIAVDTSGSVRAFVPDVNLGDPSAGGDRVEPVLRALPELIGLAGSRGVDQLGPDDTATLFAFDSSPRVVTATAPVRAAELKREYPQSPAEGSDIAAAIRAASASLSPDAAGRILLISDGLALPASPDPLAAARAAFAATKAPIDVIPFTFENPREVIVESLDAPTRVATESAPVPLTLTVTSTGDAPVSGRLRLLQEGREVALPADAETITIQPGRNVLTLRVPLSPGRLHRFEAVFEPDAPAPGERPADTVAANNRAVAFTTSPGGGRILIVDGTGISPPSAASLATLLSQTGDAGSGAGGAGGAVGAGLSVTVTTPEAFERVTADGGGDLLSLQAFDSVVLVDVPADALAPGTQQNLARYVTDTGGGLLMVGGPGGAIRANSFGAGGWKGTPIEPLLPVTLDLPDRLVMPSTAVVIILDSSGSMGRGVMGSAASQQEIANRGAASALTALDKQDLVGVIEFNSSAAWVVPLRPNDKPEETAEKITAISPNGGTNLPPALEMALAALKPVRASVKHVIVLSDGQSQGRKRLADIQKSFRDAPGGAIKISAIAVGDDADVEGMRRLAEGTGGEFFRVIDPRVLPRIFIKAVRVVRTPMIREDAFVPVLGPGGPSSPAMAGLTGAALPQLGGLVLTQPRLDAQKKNVDGVTYALLTPQGEPVLAHWRAGLGQVGAFTSSPPGSGWAAAWETPQARALWVQLVRSLSRSSTGGGDAARYDLAARIDGDSLRIRVDATAAASAPVVTVYSPTGARSEVAATLTAPGVYEASAPASDGEGVYVVTVAPSKGGSGGGVPIIGGAVKPSAAAAEYRVPSTSAAGTELLRQIARETGGRVLSLNDLKTMTAAQLLMRDKVEPRESRAPLWPILVIAACGVLLLDIANRRIAWDRAWGGESEAHESRKSTNAEHRSSTAHTPQSATHPDPEPASPLAAAKRRARKRTDEA